MKKCQWCGTVELFLLNDTYCPNDCTGPKKLKSPMAEVQASQGLQLGKWGWNAKRATLICRKLISDPLQPGLVQELRKMYPAINTITVCRSAANPGVKRLEFVLCRGKLPDELPIGVRHHASRITAPGANGGTLVYKDTHGISNLHMESLIKVS